MRAEQNNNSARALHFLVHFFAAISRLWREICLRDFLWRMQTDDELIFHFLYLRAVIKNWTPGKFAYIPHFERSVIFEKTRIHFYGDVLLYHRRRPRQQETSLLKWIFFFKYLSRLFQFTENVKCQRISLELITRGLHSCLERESKIRCSLFTFSIKREIRHFHVVVVQWRQINVQKSVMLVQSCCFANLNLLLFWRSRCRRRC